MNSVVFLMYHGVSHFVSCFSLAKGMAKDHTVIFAGHRFHESFIRSQGFMYYPLDSLPFAMGFEEWRNKTDKKKNVYLSTVKDRWQDRLFKEREQELSKLISDLDPSFLLMDSWQSTDVIVLYALLKGTRTRAALVHIMLPNEIVKGRPPLNSLARPDDSVGIGRSFRALKRKRYYKAFIQNVKYLGQSDQRMISRWMKKRKIPASWISGNRGMVSLAWDQIEEFVLTPVEFDFPGPRQPAWRHFLGFLPDRARMESTDKDFLKADQLIRQRVNETNAPLIYCAFGTAQTGDIAVIDNFLKHLVEVVKKRGYVLIIAFTNHDQLTIATGENVFLFKSVPQMNVLSRSNVFITHGGINSIKEAVYAGVPMLICPVNKKTDVVGNAVRVDYHGLGILGSLDDENEHTIDEKIAVLLAEERFKQSIEKLRKADEQYTVTAFRELLYKVQPWT